VGTLPVEGRDEVKRTNEIKTAIPLLEVIDLEGKDVTADALLAQRELADYIVRRGGHYHFTVKGNQAGTLEDLQLYFQDRGKRSPDYAEHTPPDHGRIETRRIWITTELNGYLRFPHVGQAYIVERQAVEKKTGKTSSEIAYGITSRPSEQAHPQRVLKVNRGHWVIENSCHYILDYTFDEDRSRIRTGYGPENMTRLRRFAIGVIKSKGGKSVPQKMRQLAASVRLVFDYLRMTENTRARRSRN
jgi:predicted transposase YbfD/YdcC